MKRIPAVSTDVLLRDVASLDDGVLLLPQQVVIFTGLTRGMLKERMRTRPPQPPHPMPRERTRTALWYSLGEIRRYLKDTAANAQLDRAIAATHKCRTFSEFVNFASPSATWPIALVGPQRKPVDFLATVRGDVVMARKDLCRWMTLREYMDRLRDVHAEPNQDPARPPGMGITTDDPFLSVLRALPGTRALPADLITALLPLPDKKVGRENALRQLAPIASPVDNQRRFLVDDLLNVMEKYPSRFDRPLGAQHPTFESFLHHGAANDRWVFCFAALDFLSMRRPVDILAYLHLEDDLVQGVSCLPMNRDDYVAVMSAYLSGFGAQQEAENFAAINAHQALGAAGT